MAKVYITTLLLEVADDAAFPLDDTWATGFLNNTPGLQAMSCVGHEKRPFPTIEEDPLNHTQH